MKALLKKIDDFVSQLEVVSVDPKDLSSCRIVYHPKSSFFIAISKNGKKFAFNKDGEYHTFRGFDGVLLGKYNVNIYPLLRYMIDLKIINEAEEHKFILHASEYETKHLDEDKIRTATETLHRYGFKVTK